MNRRPRLWERLAGGLARSVARASGRPLVRAGALLVLLGLLVAAGLAGAQDPKGEQGEGPFRLKRKKRGDEPPPAAKDDKEPAKDKDKPTDKDKAKDKAKEKDKAREKAKAEDEELDPKEGPPGEPEEDDKEVLERIGRNMRSVEEKLGNRELGDPTSQQQRDILKDLDALVRKKQQSQGGGGGGGGGAQQQPQGGDQDRQNEEQQGKAGRQQQRGGGQGGLTRSKQRKLQRQRRAQRAGRQNAGRRQAKSQPGGQQPEPKPQAGGAGNQGGAGRKGPESKKDLNADMYKDVWGHLPESLRAEMNAYSNPSPFLPRYDDLIKKYYRTIAEQGRKKGD